MIHDTIIEYTLHKIRIYLTETQNAHTKRISRQWMCAEVPMRCDFCGDYIYNNTNTLYRQ